ncbi:MAG: heparinase II/III family protein [Bdellovibrionia bacterium]
MKRILLTGLAMGMTLLPAAKPAFAKDDILTGLRKVHPRLLVNEATWSQLKERRKTEPVLNQILLRVEKEAQAILVKPPLTYKKEGKRLLSVSREAIRRILDLTLAYKTTDQNTLANQYKARAEKELITVAGFPDWNPTHFLDVAEMTTAVSFGYDWLYADLAPETRKILKNAIIEKALKLGDDPSLPNTSWYHKEMNWNQVCFGGLGMGALAIADEEPTEAGKILGQVLQNVSYGLKPYAPDGIYPEGPGYWGYGTTYQVLLNASLKSALGSDWELGNSPGFRTTADYLAEVTGPALKQFNFSDGDEDADLQSAVFEIARELSRPDLLIFQNRLLRETLANESSWLDRFFPLIAIWAPSLTHATKPRMPLNWKGDGPQPLAVFRSSWTNPNALYLAVKGGSASLSHAHMDAGSFVLDRDGVRWAIDLGMQNYFSLESKNVDLWSRKQDSQRWDVFRIGPFSHNTLTIGGQLHQVQGSGQITEFTGKGLSPGVTLDLSSVFAGQATKVTRQFSIVNQRSVRILDTVAGISKGKVIHWNFATRAQVKIHGRIATLTQSGKTLRLKLIEPKDGTWNLKAADPPPHVYDEKNPGVSLLSTDAVASGKADTIIKVMAY